MTTKIDRSDGLLWRRAIIGLVASCLLAGCQPEGAGSISVDPKDPAVRGFKSFEDVKRPNRARTSKAPAPKTNGSHTGLR
jgi:hypothetical protein